MPLPSETELIDGLVRAMQRLGRPASTNEQENEVIRLLDINQRDAVEIHEGTRTKLSYRLAWGRTYLKSLGLLQPVERGTWELTEKGAHYHSIADLRREDIEEFEELFNAELGAEGLDEETRGFFGEYPIDSVLIRQETRTVFEIVRRIRDERFIMDPDFQRDFIWKLDKQSKLIESMVMRIPLPVFYLAEREDGKTVVVDGLQRLTTFLRFMEDSFALRDLQLGRELNGMRYSDLPPKLQNRIEDTQLILYLIDPKVPEQAKLDIFDRVNGGVPLTRQQMRNSIYSGPATRWLRDEVQSEEFIRATGNSLDWRTMRDRECVNRFCAFSLFGSSGYQSGDMDAFLAQTLQEMNSANGVLHRLSTDFRRGMANNSFVFGPHSFRKHRRHSNRRSVINVALFDVFSVLLSRVPDEVVQMQGGLIHDAFFELMENDEFMDAITFSTNSTRKVQTRFGIAEMKLGPILDV
jgi:Protein of unknown function DUF262/Mrr N-terminal domain